jgi:hypothetical protein
MTTSGEKEPIRNLANVEAARHVLFHYDRSTIVDIASLKSVGNNSPFKDIVRTVRRNKSRMLAFLARAIAA